MNQNRKEVFSEAKTGKKLAECKPVKRCLDNLNENLPALKSRPLHFPEGWLGCTLHKGKGNYYTSPFGDITFFDDLKTLCLLTIVPSPESRYVRPAAASNSFL